MRVGFALIVIASLVMLFLPGCQETEMPVESPMITAEGTNLAKATVIKTEDIFVWDVIASGECLGEDLDIYAPYKFKAHTTLDGKGGYHTTMHWRPLKEAIGVGVETGRSWHPVGAEMVTVHSGKVGEKEHWVGTGNWFGNQPGPNLFEHWNLNYVVDENGEVTVKKEMLSMECRGN